MKPKVKILLEKYDTGPVTNEKTTNVTYLTYLNAEHVKLSKDMKTTMASGVEAEKKWVRFFFLCSIQENCTSLSTMVLLEGQVEQSHRRGSGVLVVWLGLDRHRHSGETGK